MWDNTVKECDDTFSCTAISCHANAFCSEEGRISSSRLQGLTWMCAETRVGSQANLAKEDENVKEIKMKAEPNVNRNKGNT